jgi:tetratricopeptide (TPR) repeat protein
VSGHATSPVGRRFSGLAHRLVPFLAAAAFLAQAGAAEAKQPAPPRYVSAETPAGNYLAAVVAGLTRDVNAEAQFLKEALASDPSDEAMQRQALFAFLSDGDLADAVVIGQRILRGKPAPDVALLARISLVVDAMRARRFREASNQLDEALKGGGPGDATLTTLKAWAKIGSGRPKEAFEVLKPLESGPALPLVGFMEGLMATVIRDPKTAGAALQAAYERDRREVRVADAFARHLASRGDKKAALAIYDAFSANPTRVLIAEPMAALQAGKTPPQLVSSAAEGAAEMFFILSNVGDGSPAGRMRESIYLQFASLLAPKSPVYAAALAETYETSGQNERAIAVYQNIPKTSPLRPTSDLRRVRALQRMDRATEAMTLLDELLKAKPKDLELLRAAAYLQRGEKHWSETVAYYTRAIAAVGTVTPMQWDLYYGRGVAHERAKDWALAEADFKAVLEILPKAKPGEPYADARAQVLNYLAYTWVDRRENIAQAFTMLKDAVALTGGRNGDIIDSLGWAHFRLEQYEDAVQQLEKAVALKPGDPVINEHLGDAYWKIGRKLEAGFKWNHARDLKPDPEDLTRILDKISNGLTETPKAAQSEKPGNGG